MGIVAKIGWDGALKMPTFQTVDPRNWICDPDGDYVNGDYSFTGFEKQMFKTDLINMGYPEEVIEDLNPNTGDYRGSDRSRNDDQENAYLNQSFKQENDDNPDYKIYTHFGIFE